MAGLLDFSARKIDGYYREQDEHFPEEKDIYSRLNRIFDTLVAVKPRVYHDTFFSFPQILFSLMIAMDSISAFPNEEILSSCILDIDRVMRGYQDLSELTAQQAAELSWFTGGNLHRIRARRIRHDVISRELSRYANTAERPRSVLTAVE